MFVDPADPSSSHLNQPATSTFLTHIIDFFKLPPLKESAFMGVCSVRLDPDDDLYLGINDSTERNNCAMCGVSRTPLFTSISRDFNFRISGNSHQMKEDEMDIQL
jgi:hypothetical protein